MWRCVLTKDLLELSTNRGVWTPCCQPLINRHLKREHDYKYSIIRDREFYQSKLALEGKVNHLCQQGKGERPKATSVPTSEEEGILWAAKTPVDSSPRVLSQTMWWKETEWSKHWEAVHLTIRPAARKGYGQFRTWGEAKWAIDPWPWRAKGLIGLVPPN